VVPNQDETEITIRKQIEQLVQLNEGQPTAMTAQLWSDVDEALAQARSRSNDRAALEPQIVVTLRGWPSSQRYIVH